MIRTVRAHTAMALTLAGAVALSITTSAVLSERSTPSGAAATACTADTHPRRERGYAIAASAGAILIMLGAALTHTNTQRAPSPEPTRRTPNPEPARRTPNPEPARRAPAARPVPEAAATWS